eukprot:1221677-Pyramimonas_sp.AAC.1
MPQSSTRYEELFEAGASFLGSSGPPPCSASEALPGTLPRVPTRVQAHVDAHPIQLPARANCCGGRGPPWRSSWRAPP